MEDCIAVLAAHRADLDLLDLKITVVEDPVQLFALASNGKFDVVSSTIEYGPIAAAQGMPVTVAALTNLG